MSYTPTVWQTGDTITAEKLNKLENGVANVGGYDIVFTITADGMTADGASIEELISGGNKRALVTIERSADSSFIENIGYKFTIGSGNEPTDVSFMFYMGDGTVPAFARFTFDANGSFSFGEDDGTYTYSNGHYVFTKSTQ